MTAFYDKIHEISQELSHRGELNHNHAVAIATDSLGSNVMQSYDTIATGPL
ncbi:hypothetical protein SAMN05192560_2006 [Methylobacillus rhizosphaerae]|uniref:Uncharacterized protein n=1 Tax=Methylobacillus rhizosphaerae TaxID=551994 RepID=A0A239AM67_9PROT|nr:hypothetical protein SAMN05192560_2006 [Methylobacillus rhizosphaerae]